MITAVILLCSCNNDVDRDMLKSDPKLVLYCFPGTDNDTTVIDLSSSIPVNRNVQFDRKESYSIPHATISYQLNGTELPVMYAKESTGRVPVGKYYVVAKHHCGDNISIETTLLTTMRYTTENGIATKRQGRSAVTPFVNSSSVLSISTMSLHCRQETPLTTSLITITLSIRISISSTITPSLQTTTRCD